MKKIFTLFIFVSLLFACNDSGSDDSSDASFKIQLGNIEKFGSPVPGTGTSYNKEPGAHTGSYAIIYSGTINETNYVGIACSNNPNNDTYNLKIHFTADSIPVGSSTITGARIIENNAGVTETLNLTISSPTTITAGNNTYNTYNITGSSASITSLSITALHVGLNASK